MKLLKNYEKACNKLTKKFLKDVFDVDIDPGNITEMDYFWWIGEEIGGIFNYGDWFISMGEVVDYYRYKVTPEQYLEWYDYCLEQHEKKEPIQRLELFAKYGILKK